MIGRKSAHKEKCTLASFHLQVIEVRYIKWKATALPKFVMPFDLFCFAFVVLRQWYYHIVQTNLELRDVPVSTSQVLILLMLTVMPG